MTKRCQHRPDPKLEYRVWMDDADARHKAGQHQRWCYHCRRYLWGEFWGKRRKKA